MSAEKIKRSLEAAAQSVIESTTSTGNLGGYANLEQIINNAIANATTAEEAQAIENALFSSESPVYTAFNLIAAKGGGEFGKSVEVKKKELLERSKQKTRSLGGQNLDSAGALIAPTTAILSSPQIAPIDASTFASATPPTAEQVERARKDLEKKLDTPACKIFRLYQGVSSQYHYSPANSQILKIPRFNGVTVYENASLVNDVNEMSFYYLKNQFYSSMAPTVRLYKIKRSRDDQTVNEAKEILFPSYATSILPDVISQEDIIRGNVGIKSFSYSYLGTDRFTSERDIEATLVIYAEKLDSIFEQREGGFSYSDLMIQADCYSGDSRERRDYRPSCYEIIADVGWAPNNNWSALNDLNNEGKRVFHPDVPDEGRLDANSTAFKKLFRTSMNLVVVDHQIKLQANGSVEIEINYRARLEATLRSPRGSIIVPDSTTIEGQPKEALEGTGCEDRTTVGDAISCLEATVAALQQEQQGPTTPPPAGIMGSISNFFTGGPEPTQLQKCNTALDVIREHYANSYLKTITDDLLEKNKVFAVNYANAGSAYETYLKTPNYENLQALIGAMGSTPAQTLNAQAETADAFVYFGDIIDSILSVKGPDKLTDFRIVLGSIKLPDSAGNMQTYSIGAMPIAMKTIQSYVTDKVAKSKNNLSLFAFIRELTNYVLVNGICLENAPKYRAFFNQATSYGKEPIGDTLSQILDSINPIFDSTSIGAGGTKIYYVLHVGFEDPTFRGISTGTVGGDLERFIPHYLFGASGGIFTSLSLEKTDQPYLREARFEKAGDRNILNQLSNVYDANIEMFGNNMLNPGSLIYLNLGHTARNLGNPTNPNSNAYILGLGGLHLVTKVTSNLTPSSFKTTVKARFVSRGTS